MSSGAMATAPSRRSLAGRMRVVVPGAVPVVEVTADVEAMPAVDAAAGPVVRVAGALMAGEVVWRAWTSRGQWRASHARDAAWELRATGTPMPPTGRLR